MDPATISLIASTGLTVADKLGLFGGGAPDYEAIARRLGSRRIAEAEQTAGRMADATEEAVLASGGGASALVNARTRANGQAGQLIGQARTAADEAVMRAALGQGQAAEAKRQNTLQGAYGLLNGYLTYQGLKEQSGAPVAAESSQKAAVQKAVAPPAQPLAAAPVAAVQKVAAPPVAVPTVVPAPPVSLVPNPTQITPRYAPVDLSQGSPFGRVEAVSNAPYQPTMIYRSGGMLPDDDPTPRRYSPEELRDRVYAAVEAERDARRPSLLQRMMSTAGQRRSRAAEMEEILAAEEASLRNADALYARGVAGRGNASDGLGPYRSLGEVNAGFRTGGMLPDDDPTPRRYSPEELRDRVYAAVEAERDARRPSLLQRMMSTAGQRRSRAAEMEEILAAEEASLRNADALYARGVAGRGNASDGLGPYRSLGEVNAGFREGGMLPIPGSDATEVVGPKHEDGGVPHESGAEVEGGETIDGATVEGQTGDYVFSDAVAVPDGFGRLSGLTFAEAHKMMLDAGATDDQVSALAGVQEETTGRA